MATFLVQYACHIACQALSMLVCTPQRTPAAALHARAAAPDAQHDQPQHRCKSCQQQMLRGSHVRIRIGRVSTDRCGCRSCHRAPLETICPQSFHRVLRQCEVVRVGVSAHRGEAAQTLPLQHHNGAWGSTSSGQRAKLRQQCHERLHGCTVRKATQHIRQKRIGSCAEEMVFAKAD